jgi:hypothetical protein
MLAFAIRRVGEPHCRGLLAAGGPVIADIGPQPPRLGLDVARFQHRYGQVVTVQFLSTEDIALQRGDQRPQRPARAASAYPVG